MAGDTNGDRRVDSLDLLAVNALLASGGYDKDADVNGDGVINSLDRLLVMRGRNRVLASHLWLDDWAITARVLISTLREDHSSVSKWEE